MPPRVLCPGGDHRPPATGGSCACGMVTRVPSRTATGAPRARSCRRRCATCSRAASTTARVTRSRRTPTTTGSADMQISRLLRLRADRVLALLSDAGLVVTADGELRQAA